MSPERIRELFRRLRAANPEPRTELEYGSPFQLLVAVILSAQSTDKAVNRATRELFRVAPTPAAMLELGEEGLKRHIASIGLYNTKARNILATCRTLLERHAGEVPRSRTELEALPGVGRKTANVILNTAFGEETIAVDTHIFRVANRTGLAAGRTPLEVEHALMAVVPQCYRRHAHHWLILHGRYTCTARSPRCDACPIRDLCTWPDRPEEEGPAGASSPGSCTPGGAGRAASRSRPAPESGTGAGARSPGEGGRRSRKGRAPRA